MRRETTEHLLTTGIMNDHGKYRGGRLREKMTEGITQCLYSAKQKCLQQQRKGMAPYDDDYNKEYIISISRVPFHIH